MDSETLADIAREMREQANEPTIESLGEVFPPVGTEDVKDWADRIEAAAERDKQAAMKTALMAKCEICAQLAPQCNAAAMRTALEGMYTASQQVFRNFARDVFAGERRLNPLEIAYDEAEAALDAPARNCDRFAAVDEAKAEWLRTNAKLMSSTGLMPFESWLFAPAEGGAE